MLVNAPRDLPWLRSGEVTLIGAGQAERLQLRPAQPSARPSGSPATAFTSIMGTQQEMRLARSIDDLIDLGLIAPERRDALHRVPERFSVAVTDDVAALIDATDAADPIAAQFLPDEGELETAPEERLDPIGDDRWSPIPGIVHRYPDRVLLKPSLLCPVYCRFCFRRESVGKQDAMLDAAALERALDYIRQRPEIWEVIVTGGDPLLLSARRVAKLVQALEAIPHL